MSDLNTNEVTYIVGHLKPDADAICSAIGHAAYLADVCNTQATPVRCGEVPTRCAWALEQANIKAPQLVGSVNEGQKLILVDHNEFQQAITGVEKAEIVGVLDHHRLSGDVRTSQPIYFRNEPVGSTCSLVADNYRKANAQPSRSIAICLIAGLISDTLCLTSPTTTDFDRKILPWLADIAGVDAKEFTSGFFAAGSMLNNGTPSEMLEVDRKEFVEADKTLTIAQVEEVGLAVFDQRREEIEAELNKLCSANNYEVALAVFTDITTQSSKIIAAGNPEIIANLSFEHIDDTLFDAPGVCSRKKQIFPALAEAMATCV